MYGVAIAPASTWKPSRSNVITCGVLAHVGPQRLRALW
jgi:hypothetical protein